MTASRPTPPARPVPQPHPAALATSPNRPAGRKPALHWRPARLAGLACRHLLLKGNPSCKP
jgi:hypothetical protein